MTEADKKVIIEALKAIDGAKRKLQDLIKQPNSQATKESKGD